MKSTSKLFKNNLDKEFSKLPVNIEFMKDADKYKSEFKEEKLEGGVADNKKLQDIFNSYNKKNERKVTIDFLKKQLKKGIEVEKEHTKDKQKAKEITMDHLSEDPRYYIKLKKIEQKEATSTGSSGQYLGKVAFADSEFVRKSNSEMKKIESNEATSTSSSGQYSTPAFVAPNKKNWRGAQKPLYKGGQFVKIKKKCLTFPYCNQGDINALKLTEGSSLERAIRNVSEKTKIHENIIKNLVLFELKKIEKANKLNIYNKKI